MKLKIGAKLGLGFGVIILLMIVSGLVSYLKADEVKSTYTYILSNRVPSLRAAQSLAHDLDYAGNKTRQAILAGTQPARKEDAQNRWDGAWARIDKEIAKLDELSKQWVLQENKDRLADIKGKIPVAKQMQKATIDTANSGERDAIVKGGDQYADKVTPFVDGMTKELKDLSDALNKALDEQQEKLDAANRALVWALGLSTLLAIIIGSFVAIVLSRTISGSTNALLQKAEAIAASDLSTEELNIHSQDELGDLGKAINGMQVNLRQVIQAISENAQNVANASEEFSSVSQQITANSEETSAQANAVSAATEEVNRNLQSVATATEEMSASISEIAKNATEAAKVAGSAMQTATETNAIVTKLGESSAEIGQVIKAITSIAQKTDLLALNATVEAARAGEVGAGFAVVANEVKELAKQTASATEDISRKIEAIQADAKASVQAIGQISGIISQVNQISGTIAAAVEEQSATTNEMSRNLSEAAKGAGEVGQNIHGVAQAAQNTSQGATDSLKAAQQLAKMSTQLRGLVEKFKLDDSGRRGRAYGGHGRSSNRQESAAEVEQGELVPSR
ncbi:MAG TPA: methyl-accepting chemotaxis protein [Methylomirabilota bacterium]|nr:methyl-accepting chemotaxis protein [Methylomirabilota bacterium]